MLSHPVMTDCIIYNHIIFFWNVLCYQITGYVLITSTFFDVVLFLILSISNDLFITVTSSQNYFQTLNNVFTRNKYKNYMIGGLKALQYNHLFSLDVLRLVSHRLSLIHCILTTPEYHIKLFRSKTRTTTVNTSTAHSIC